MKREKKNVPRREFLRSMGTMGAVVGLVVGSGNWSALASSVSPSPPETADYDWTAHKYAMLFDLERCIGCGRCVQACKTENDVPRQPDCFRSWVERYIIKVGDEVRVDSPNGGADGFPADVPSDEIFRSFYVPKTCNHCTRPPCVQSCPTGATYATKEGVVLVDRSYCIGCRYCIQACPYGARYLHPDLRVADKCTFCYHRITRGLRPACVEVCPQNVRVFGDLRDPDSELVKLLRRRPIQVLKPALNTGPKVFYLNLDREVR